MTRLRAGAYKSMKDGEFMKKLLALLLALCLTMGLMAGCGDTASSAASSTGAATENEETQAEETAEASEAPATETETGSAVEEETSAVEPGTGEVTELAKEVFGEDAAPEEVSYPIDTDETLSLIATFPDPLFASYPNAMADCSIYKVAEEKTGIHVEYEGLSTSASAEKFNVMIAGGDLPDMVGWGLNYTSGNDDAIEKEDYLDLSEYVAEYAPNYYKYLSTDDQLLKSALTASGYLPAFFALVTEDSLSKAGLVIRTDELEKLGLDKPYTIDEWEETLEAFKNDGIDQPLVMLAPGAMMDNWIAGAFDVAAYCNNFPMSAAPIFVKDGEIKFGPIEDGFLDYITLMNDWYNKGYIDPDFISINANWNGPDYSAAITNGEAGIFYTDWGNIGGYIEASEIEGFDLEATYDMHASEDSVNHFAVFTKKSAGNGVIITSNCDNVELACRWADWWYTDEGSLLANYGVEGEGFEYVDGVPTFTELVTDSDLGMRDALLVYASNNTICCVVDNNAVASGYSEVDKAAPEIWAEGMDDEYVIPTTVTQSLSAEENTEAVNIYSDIETLCMEYIAKFITGDKSLDEYDSFVEQIESMNIQGYLDIYQEAYDRYMEG